MQTSLIPTVISLSDFFSKNWPNVSWYPFWYLGNPYHYLIGPAVPLVLMLGSKLLHQPLLEFFLGLIIISLVLGGVGVYLLLKSWGTNKKIAVLAGIFYTVLPGGLFLLNYQNGLHQITFGVLPYLLIFYRRFLNEDQKLFNLLSLSLLICFVLLIDISILLPIIIGMMAVLAASNLKDQLVAKIIKSALVLLSGLFLSSIWYTLQFWGVILANPSLGGVPLFNLITKLFNLSLNILPVVAAILVLKWKKVEPKGCLLFANIFLASFLFLTAIRFVLDPDFMIDWIGFLLEIQFGLAIILGDKLGRTWQRNQVKGIGLSLAVLGLSFLTGAYIIERWHSLRLDQYQKQVLSQLQKTSGERVFLTGSPVFWINSSLNLSQIRGGVDQSAIHPFWSHGAYQIREGNNSQLAKDWLKALGTSYILVQGPDSPEFFHDFKNTDRFSKLPLISETVGDKLYKVEEGEIGRVASSDILKIPKPKNGADTQALADYTATFKIPLPVSFEKPNKISLAGNIAAGRVVSLAITYDPGWKIIQGQGKIVSDALGNMVVIPAALGNQKIILHFEKSFLDYLLPILFYLGVLLLLVNFDKWFKYKEKEDY